MLKIIQKINVITSMNSNSVPDVTTQSIVTRFEQIFSLFYYKYFLAVQANK